MKKILFVGIVAMMLFSCTKETVPTQYKKESKVFIQAVAVSGDGSLDYSPVIMLK